ncbi:MAG: hypothetical protein R3B74_13425 [Nitrospirales bacterium]|nr:hypothetical protein [Nitrospirales bacterium]
MHLTQIHSTKSPSPDRFQEECAVFGIFGHREAANLTYLGLYAQQHRGQEGSGIVSSDGERFYQHKGLGLVADIFSKKSVRQLIGTGAIGHNRYSTAGSGDLHNVQPLVVNFAFGNLGLAHNGNLINAGVLRGELEAYGAIFQSDSDSEVVIHLIAHSKGDTMVSRVIDALTLIRGAFSLVILTDDHLIAARDPYGFRPLSLGKYKGSWVVASETCAFDLIGAEFVREVEPGEMVAINHEGLTSYHPFTPQNRAQCIFEYVYFARPDSKIFGSNAVYPVRKAFGRQLAKECPAQADIVIPVPDSGYLRRWVMRKEWGWRLKSDSRETITSDAHLLSPNKPFGILE